MSGQLLHVTQAAAGLDDLLCYSGNERAPPGMRACAGKSEFLIEPVEPDPHGTGAHAGVALAVDDVILGVGIAMSVDNPLEQQSMRSTDQASTESSAINKLRRLSDGDYKRIVPSCLAVNYSWAAINPSFRRSN